MIDDNFKAGDHAFFRISIQMAPEDEIFGWYIFVTNEIVGGLNG
jgi:hypothetical protein